MILAGCALMALVLGVCVLIAADIAGGHQSGCLRRTIGVHALIGWTLLCIAAVYAWRTVRHPLRYARYLAVRVIRRHGRCDPDGEPLDRDEMRAFIGIVRAWRLPAYDVPERSRT